MVKVPQAGRVKTRLAREIGAIPALWWFRHQLRSLVRRVQDPRWDLVLAVSPDANGLMSRQFPPGIARVPQGRGDLGVRMARQLRGGTVCVIGADIPGIEQRHISKAFQQLGTVDAVFGPAPDGGFWLVGHAARRPVPAGIFTGARWSGPDALADSVASLPDHRIGYADTLRDVDTAADFAMTPRGPHVSTGI